MSTTKDERHGAVAGQVERGVRPHAEMLARRLQAAAYSHGYEDASPANATTRQAKTDAVSRQTLADLLIAIAAQADARDAHRGGDSYEASMLRNLLARIHRDGGHYLEQHGLDKALEDADAQVVQWLAGSDALNSARESEMTAAQEADELRATLRELVALADMKARLENLHSMGHGTDWDSYHKRHPAAWAAARLLALGPNVELSGQRPERT